MAAAHEIESIQGAFGTIHGNDASVRRGLRARILTLLAILGPGIIVMVGDNDAGGISTYAQAGQNFGYSLLWVLPLLIPVLIVNQEMVVRLGAVTGVGHGRLIRERYGRTWGNIAVFELFVLNFLTIATEFIGVNLALSYFHVSAWISVPIAGATLIAMTTSGSFRRWERFMFLFIFANLLVIPLIFMAHPSPSEIATHLVTPGVSGGVTSNSVLLIIAIVGTTVAPWQLFFQQSNIIDKKITPRWINYERADTVIGSFITVVTAICIMAIVAASFLGTKFFGHYTDALGVAEGLKAHVGSWAGAFFAIILLNASIIGAAAVTLATTYAFGDLGGSAHLSLNKGWREAKGFYGGFSALVFMAAGLILIPGAPLGLITTTVQALAGLLLPLATVFLLLLCNDSQVLGPWVNRPWLNAVSTVIVSLLVVLSLILMVTTVFPHVDVVLLCEVLGGVLLVLLASGGGAWLMVRQPRTSSLFEGVDRKDWRMPSLNLLSRPPLVGWRRWTLVGMAAYLVLSVLLLVVKAFQIG
jgi:NRAMP (natural resistance-associated macrophage protein)-like metal ion transporter